MKNHKHKTMNNKKIWLSRHDEDHQQKYIQEAFNTNWVVPLGPNIVMGVNINKSRKTDEFIVLFVYICILIA